MFQRNDLNGFHGAFSNTTDSTSQQPPKKSKITLHFNNNGNAGGSPDPASTTTSAKPSPSPHPVPAAASGSTPLSISVSSNGGPSAAGLDKKNKRVVDPDRQCGVINERGLPCQRSLTCKTHNMTAKRAVPHRSQPFDSLLLEWQKASRLGKEREALSKNLREGNAIAAAANLVGPAGLGQAHGGVGMNGYDEQGGVAVPGSGKKDKKKKNANQNQPFAANGVPMFDGSSAMSPLQTNGNLLLPPNGAAPATASTTAKKSKKPSNNAPGSSAAANGQMVYYVGEAPPRATTATRNGAAADDEEEEESDYLSSSDEVESVLLSIQKLTNRTATDSPIMTASPLVMREGGGSGFSSASWFTGRNRKLLRLRELGLDTVFAGAQGGGAGGGVAGVKGAKR